MDGHLAGEAHPASGQGFPAEPFFVMQVHERRIDGLQRECRGGQDQSAPGPAHLQAAGAAYRAEVAGQVLGAEEERFEALPRAGDFPQVNHPPRRLDKSQQWQGRAGGSASDLPDLIR